MADTYILIASATVGSGGSSSVTFSSIPSTYTDLILKSSARSEGTSSTAILLRLNGSSSSGSNRGLEGNGASVSSYSDPSQSYLTNMVPSNYTSNTFSNGDLYIPNYNLSISKSSSSDSVTENTATIYALQNLQGNLWANTAAVTSITLVPNGTNNIAQNSTFYLYGIKSS